MKDVSNTFMCPFFESSLIDDKITPDVLKAQFSDLRNLYKQESNQLIKKCFRLNYKSLYPSLQVYKKWF